MFLLSKKNILINFLFCLLFSFLSFESLISDDALKKAILSEDRTAEYVQRDRYRNPLGTLSFFQIKKNMTVIELQPSGGISPTGWYTEILAPFLRKNGLLIAAHFNPSESEWRKNMRRTFEEKVKYDKNYNKIQMSMLSMPPRKLTKDNSADMVLTFRNLHNWLKSGYLKEVFQVSYNALKPGGIFGVVEHRAPDNFEISDMKKQGYVSEKLTIKLAKEVGFILKDKSEINANPKDSKDHPNGVWNLPPTLKVNDDKDRNKFLNIGESDRMTLKFIKPKN